MEYLLIAASDTLIDNIAMTNGSSPTKTGHRTIIRHIEHRLISIVMSVIAYLLEKAVLRSIRRDKTES
jgi:L-aminopeptidase/D-esterase-like protein